MSSTDPKPLRSRLFMLAASALLPLVIAAVLGTAYLIGTRQEEAQRSALELARALATAVDSELQSTIGVLQSVALSELAGVQPAQFRELAQRLSDQRGWRTIHLADATGQLVWASRLSQSEDIPRAPSDPASMKLALDTGAPVVGRVMPGRRIPGGAFAVRVPVVKDGHVVGVLSAVVAADQFLKVLTRQNVPPKWVVGIFDQDGTRVARTMSNTTYQPAPSLQALMDTGAQEGMGPTHTLEGVPSFSGFSRLKGSSWAVAVGIPQAEVQLALLPLLLSLGGGLLASLALSGYLAMVFARRVSQPIEALKGAAGALGRGERFELPTLGISDLEEVGTALNSASAEREKYEAERERLLLRLTDALREAEDAARGKDQFLALLAHELRNPLAPIRNGVQILRMCPGANRGPSGELLPMMERQLSHMARLLDDLLDVSRVANGKIELHKERIDVAHAVRAAVEANKPLMDSKRHRISVSLPQQPLMLDADPVRVAQILLNLLNNAANYSSPGGSIHLSVERDGDDARFAVNDTGVGLRPEDLDRIFVLFVQLGPPFVRREGGLGVGLALVRAMVDLHGGRVEARSAGPGRGSEFIVHLPALPAEALEESPSLEEAGVGS